MRSTHAKPDRRPPRSIRAASACLLGLLGLLAACPAEPPLTRGECGDGVLNLGEECDNGPLNDDSTPDTCRTDCRLPHCGDGVADSGEVCDGSDLKDQDCASRGFRRGVLACAPDCTLDVSGCWTCGDGMASGPEQCDGTDLRGLGCGQLGFQGGTLACKADCRFDFSGCVGGCGNGRKEAGEACDGVDLGGASCETLGFQGGFLACAEDCTFDRRGCVGGCGNGVVEEGEACDDGNEVPYDGCTDCRGGSGDFAVASETHLCQGAQAVAAADLDGDGNQDLVVGCSGLEDGQGLVLLLAGPDGTFQPAQVPTLRGIVSSLALADLDGDGTLDLAAAGWTGLDATGFDNGFVAFFPGRGDGTFDASQFLAEPGVWDLAALDWNDDGISDLVTAERNAQRLGLLLVMDGGTLATTSFLSDYGQPLAVAGGDLDGDGVVDLVAVRQRYGYADVFYGLGGGAFSTATVRRAGDRPRDLIAANVNGDPFPDILVPTADGIVTLVSLGPDGLRYAGVSDLEGEPGRAAAGFVTADGKLGLAVTDPAGDALWLLAGGGDGSFQVLSQTQVCDSPVDVALLDFDHDFLLDAAVVCSFDGRLALLRGLAASPGR